MTDSEPGKLGKDELALAQELELSDEDILDAMAHISGYIDISTEDFRAIYHLAWQHALARLQGLAAAEGDGGSAA